MLEIPEAYSLTKQLQKTVQGKEITQVIAAQSPHGFAFYNGEPSDYPRLLSGNTIEAVEAIGGMIKVYLGDMRLLFHDGTNIRYLDSAAKLPQKHQLLLGFSDNSYLVCTVQMYGALFAYEHGSLDNPYYKAAREKPNPLSSEFNAEWFAQIIAEAPEKLSIKGLLATEQRIPGLGNGCLQDILFQARLNPQSKVATLSKADQEKLYNAVKTVLRQMADLGGRNTEKDLFGNPGGYQSILSAKTCKEPCPVCGGAITRKAYMGGNVYFCGHCQPLQK